MLQGKQQYYIDLVSDGFSKDEVTDDRGEAVALVLLLVRVTFFFRLIMSGFLPASTLELGCLRT